MTTTRRILLRRAAATAAAAAALPPWARVLPARAAVPRRLVVFNTPNGSSSSAWGARGVAAAADLGPVLEPLADFREHLLVLKNVDNRAGLDSPRTSSPHYAAYLTLLTGARCLGQDGDYGAFGGVSFDELVGPRLNGGTRPIVHLGVQIRAARFVSARGPRSPVAAELNPQLAFDRLFGRAGLAPAAGGSTDEATARARLRRRRQSVFDHVRRELDALGRELPAEDRDRLLVHAELTRGLERRLAAEPVPTAACQVPARPSPPSLSANDSLPALGRLHMDLIVRALACDATRVATLQWGYPLDGHVFTWVGAREEHHLLSHWQHPSGDLPTGRAEYDRCSRFYAAELAYLLGELAKVREGEGTLLDSTLVLWCTEHGRGRSHTFTDIPFVMAGRAGGFFRTGRLVDVQGRTTNDLYLTIGQALGLPDARVGDPAYLTGPIEALR
jgi:hypothetical protein